MSNFVVSARKYRPVRFDDVVGQEHVSQTLKNALKNDHLAHAFLFCGPRGVGKTTCARILAKVLNCEQVTDDYEPCNTCSSCQSFNNNASFNITELDAASNNSVEHIRALIEQVRFQPQKGRYKVFIIDEVHMLSSQAFNAFLKTLEEPPPYAIFILATTEKHKIIPTILSRCQIFDFKRIQIPDMVAHLEAICQQEGLQAENDALHIIAEKADGALRDALSIFDRITSFSGNQIRYNDVIENLNVLDHDYFFRLVDSLLAEDVSQVLLIFDDILRKGFDGDIFLAGLSSHLRNLLVCQDKVTLPLLEKSENLTQRFQQQAELADTSFILTALNLANTCDIQFKLARNKRLHVEMALIKMTYIKRAVHLAQNPGTAPVPEKKTPDPTLSPKKEAALPPPAPEKPAEPPPPKPEPQPEATTGTGLNARLRLKGKGMLSLDAIEKEIQNQEEKEIRQPESISAEELEQAWQSYLDRVESNYIRSVLTDAKRSIKEDAVVMIVGSKHAYNTVLEEMALMEHLRQQLKVPHLQRDIRVDEQKRQAPPPPKKILKPRDKFIQMRETNPLVSEIQKRFDLNPDED